MLKEFCLKDIGNELKKTKFLSLCLFIVKSEISFLDRFYSRLN